MRQVRHIMGMPISIEIPGAPSESVFLDAFSQLSLIDGRFSTYKDDSEVSRFAKSDIDEKDLSLELKIVIKACRDWEKRTDGYFSAWAGGGFDPSGYVKGWAIAGAGKTIEGQGYNVYCIGAGGDILAKSDGSKIWNIGIQSPNNTSKILDTLSIASGAVATSGSYERGGHILNPKTKKPARGMLSISVAGPDIITADVLATAAFAEASGRLIDKHAGYEFLLVDSDGGIRASRGWPSSRNRESSR